MPNAIDDFRLWYVKPMVPLEANGHAGFIFVMVTFPLLERYLRGKFSIAQTQSGLTPDAYNWINQNFPEISGHANEFWSGYRHALLHQATFQAQRFDRNQGVYVSAPSPFISGHDPRTVYFDATANHFYMNPVAFYKAVIATIEGDFSSYERSSLTLPQAQSPVYQPVFSAPTAGPVILIPSSPNPTGILPSSTP